MADPIKTIPLADLPYTDRNLRYGATARESQYARDYALNVLRGKTNLLRLAHDYNTSYATAEEKSVSHYRDYLTAEAALNSLRSAIYVDDNNLVLNTRAERVLPTLPEEKRWVYQSPRELKDNPPKYSGGLGTPAYYFNIAAINDYPIPTLQKLASTVWSVNGVDPKLGVSERMSTLYRYLALPADIDERVERALREFDGTSNDPNNFLAVLAKRYFITTEDLRNIKQKILFGTYAPQAMDVLYFLLNREEQSQFTESLRYANSVAAPGGTNLLLQTLAMEGYARSAAVLDTLPPEVAYGKLTDFLYRNPDYAEQKYEIGANLNMVANAFNLIDASGLRSDAKKFMARAHNNSMYWLEASGHRDGIEPNGWHSFVPFVQEFLPGLLSRLLSSAPDSPVFPFTDFHEAMQGRPAKNTSTVLTANKAQGYNIIFDTTSALKKDPALALMGPELDPLFRNDVIPLPFSAANSDLMQGSASEEPTLGSSGTQTLAVITPDPPSNGEAALFVEPEAIESSNSTLVEGGENLSAYVAHDGPQTSLTYSQYENLSSASNVVVVQTGLPAYDLSPQINNYVEQQTRGYETVNTLFIAPTPRGILGYEEMTRGMVSHLFRDSQSDEYVAAVKVDGAREEHTARIGGLLQQLQTTHLDSEIKVLKKWGDAVDSII